MMISRYIARAVMILVVFGSTAMAQDGMQPGQSQRRAQELANNIIEDLRGAGYYADPKILADLIRPGNARSPDDERNAIEIIRMLLRMYATESAQKDQIKKRLADSLVAMGVR